MTDSGKQSEFPSFNRLLNHPLSEAWIGFAFGYLVVGVLAFIAMTGTVSLRVIVWELPPIPKENGSVFILISMIGGGFVLPAITGVCYATYRYKRAKRRLANQPSRL